MTGVRPQPRAFHADGCGRLRQACGILLLLLLVVPLAGCLLPLASDLGMAHSALHHYHLFKPVLTESPPDNPPSDSSGPMLSTTTEIGP